MMYPGGVGVSGTVYVFKNNAWHVLDKNAPPFDLVTSYTANKGSILMGLDHNGNPWNYVDDKNGGHFELLAGNPEPFSSLFVFVD